MTENTINNIEHKCGGRTDGYGGFTCVVCGKHYTESSKGRTADFDSANGGSSPSSVTNKLMSPSFTADITINGQVIASKEDWDKVIQQLSDMKHENERLKRNLEGRDNFIVDRGLFEEFLETLPRNKDSENVGQAVR